MAHPEQKEKKPTVSDTSTVTDTIDNSVTTGTDEAEDTTVLTPTVDAIPAAQVEETETGVVVHVIDTEVAARILQLCNSAIASYFYMSNPKRVAALESALAIPVSDDKSFTMFFSHSEKDLIAEAYREARKIGTTPADVTNVQVIAEAQRRYKDKHGKLAIVNEEWMI